MLTSILICIIAALFEQPPTQHFSAAQFHFRKEPLELSQVVTTSLIVPHCLNKHKFLRYLTSVSSTLPLVFISNYQKTTITPMPPMDIQQETIICFALPSIALLCLNIHICIRNTRSGMPFPTTLKLLQPTVCLKRNINNT